MSDDLIPQNLRGIARLFTDSGHDSTIMLIDWKNGLAALSRPATVSEIPREVT